MLFTCLVLTHGISHPVCQRSWNVKVNCCTLTFLLPILYDCIACAHVSSSEAWALFCASRTASFSCPSSVLRLAAGRCSGFPVPRRLAYYYDATFFARGFLTYSEVHLCHEADLKFSVFHLGSGDIHGLVLAWVYRFLPAMLAFYTYVYAAISGHWSTGGDKVIQSSRSFCL